ncbi:hypothetical protein BBP40_000270 [Aspergillus hancockii]|nr:hypothetical protein BBP40_000270 [Aspergillus hancockii]
MTASQPKRKVPWRDEKLRAMDFAYFANPDFEPTVNTFSGLSPPTYPRPLLAPSSFAPIFDSLESDDSFRLLEVRPGKKLSPIIARTHIHRLGDYPSYEALSYVWGQGQKAHTITVNGRNIGVTQSLFCALESLRLEQCSRFLWIDMICINQDDPDEKTNQVQLMSRIYSSAIHVLVWLGSDDKEESTLAFDLVCRVVNYFFQDPTALFSSAGHQSKPSVPHKLPALDCPEWMLLQSLFQLRWFWRVWVIQEIGLSASATLIWGDSEISWEWVGFAAAIIRLKMSELFEFWSIPGISNAYFMYRISSTSGAIFQPVSLSFSRLLTMTQQYETSDPYDRVYGLLALPCSNLDPNSSPFIKPDYKLSLRDAYRKAAIKIIKRERSLAVLSGVQHGPEVCLAHESWVPQWNRLFTKSLLSSDNTQRHNADNGTPLRIELSDDDYILGVQGFDTGWVTSVYSTMERTWFAIAQDYSSEGTASQDNRQLLSMLFSACEDDGLLAWTLTAGKDWYSFLVEDERSHMSDFSAWLSAIVASPTSQSTSGTSTGTSSSGGSSKASEAIVSRSLSEMSPLLSPVLDTTNTQSKQCFEKSHCERIYALSDTVSLFGGDGKSWRFVQAAQNACSGRRLFITDAGMLGLGPAAMEPGDRLCILFGASTPFILRRHGQSWQLIGECYVKCLMSGEFVKKAMAEEKEVANFVLC